MLTLALILVKFWGWNWSDVKTSIKSGGNGKNIKLKSSSKI